MHYYEQLPQKIERNTTKRGKIQLKNALFKLLIMVGRREKIEEERTPECGGGWVVVAVVVVVVEGCSRWILFCAIFSAFYYGGTC